MRILDGAGKTRMAVDLSGNVGYNLMTDDQPQIIDNYGGATRGRTTRVRIKSSRLVSTPVPSSSVRHW
jgi:hypothetical protein